MENNNERLNDCPSCGKAVYDDGWHLDDGPCVDGKFYCMARGCPCGCVVQQKKEKENDRNL